MTQAYSKIVQPYVDALNEILNKTVTDSRLVTLELQRDNYEATVFLITRWETKEIRPLELRGGNWLHFRQQVVEDGERLNVLEARYIFSHSDDVDDEDRHVFRWEYTREPPGGHVPFGHLHVYAGGLKHTHFPTRRLSLEQILWLVVSEFGVQPKDDHWYKILKDGHLDFLRRVRDSEDALLPFP